MFYQLNMTEWRRPLQLYNICPNTLIWSSSQSLLLEYLRWVMESIYTKLALYGSKNERARTDTVFVPISQVYNGKVSLTPWIIPRVSGQPHSAQESTKMRRLHQRGRETKKFLFLCSSCLCLMGWGSSSLEILKVCSCADPGSSQLGTPGAKRCCRGFLEIYSDSVQKTNIVFVAVAQCHKPKICLSQWLSATNNREKIIQLLCCM